MVSLHSFASLPFLPCFSPFPYFQSLNSLFLSLTIFFRPLSSLQSLFSFKLLILFPSFPSLLSLFYFSYFPVFPILVPPHFFSSIVLSPVTVLFLVPLYSLFSPNTLLPCSSSLNLHKTLPESLHRLILIEAITQPVILHLHKTLILFFFTHVTFTTHLLFQSPVTIYQQHFFFATHLSYSLSYLPITCAITFFTHPRHTFFTRISVTCQRSFHYPSQCRN